MRTLNEYKNWLENIQEDEYLEFVWKIMKSPYTEFHYSLMKDKSLEKKFRDSLSYRFNEHNDSEDFLIRKLDNNEDYDLQGQILFILGKINKTYKQKILDYAIEFTKNPDDFKRDRALIVLGWIGKVKQTKILEYHLLNDTNIKCRAWSASSFMQMWFNGRKVKQKAYSAFEKALKQETEPFVLSVILSSIREIGKTKLGISQQALDDLDINKINITKEKAIRYIIRELKKTVGNKGYK